MGRIRFPPWLRRAIEAALIATVVALAAIAGELLAAAGGAFPLPAGPAGSLVLAPSVLALAVITSAYPVAMAATRSDALLGAVAAFLLAGDATLILGAPLASVPGAAVELPVGLLIGGLALVPALAGLVAGQVATPLGFGRRAGAWTAVVSAIGGLGAIALLAGLL